MGDELDISAPSQAVLDEALMPDLTQDEFRILDRVVKIKPLSYKNQKLLTHRLSTLGAQVMGIFVDFENAKADIEEERTAILLGKPVAKGAGKAGIKQVFNEVDKLIKETDLAFEVVYMLCVNDGMQITREDLENQSEVGIGSMNAIAIKFFKKQDYLRPVIDFFMQEITPKLSNLKSTMTRALDKAIQEPEETQEQELTPTP